MKIKLVLAVVLVALAVLSISAIGPRGCVSLP